MAIILQTDLDKVIERNSKRKNSEDLEFIKLRYDLHRISKPKSKKFYFYKNGKNLDMAISECLYNLAIFFNKK